MDGGKVRNMSPKEGEMTTYLDKSLQRDIDIIQKKVNRMGELVISALRTALKSLVDGDRQLSYLVILRDQYVDEMEKEIDRLCQEFFVRHLPAGGTLRFVYSVIKVNNELERVGDYAESVARQAMIVNSARPQMSYENFEKIGELAISMLQKALESFEKKDKALADSILKKEKLDKDVDKLRYQIHDEIIDLRQKELIPLDLFQPLMIIASRFERVADQASNICEETMYFATGHDPKHLKSATYRVLFVDDTDSCRTQLAAAAGNSLALKDFRFESAGLNPKGIDQMTTSFLLQKGIEHKAQCRSVKDVSDLKKYQIIIALSEKGQKVFPEFPTKIVTLSWLIDDPSVKRGTPAEIQETYEKTFNYFHAQINDLVTAILGEESNYSEDK